MRLSISTSKIKKSILLLLCVAIWARLLSAFYVIYISPAAIEQGAVRALKRNYAQELDRIHESKVVFVGGSSTSFGIVPSEIEQVYGIPAVNAGLNAGMGAGFLMLWGCMLCEPGDTLVLMIEPPILSDPYTLTIGPTLAELEMPKAYWKMKRSFFGGSLWDARWRFGSIKTSGAGLTDIIGKLLRGYHLSGDWMNYMQLDGHVRITTWKGAAKPISNMDMSFSDESHDAFRWLSEYCHKNDIQVCYVFPRLLFKGEMMDQKIQEAEVLSGQIAQYMPSYGASHFATTNATLFTEAPLHQNASAAREFSVKVVKILMDAGTVSKLKEKSGSVQ